MSEVSSSNVNYNAFLADGGEMGEYIRNYDWSSTSLGPVSSWPISLLTTIGIILHSKFPMFLFWGPDHLCFYNDAYRPSLGNDGKHPGALGKSGADVWPEIWKDIKPLIDHVLYEKGSSWSEDQLLPIYRNGHLEDVNWTFSYSPVFGTSGNTEGVFVTCMETTEKVSLIKRLTESEKRFRTLIKNATVGVIVLIGEDMTVDIVNEMYCRIISRKYEDIIGRPIFDVIPETKEYFETIIEKVRISGEPIYLYDHPYFVIENGLRKEGYINIVYQPYYEEDDKIIGVIVLVHDVTEQVNTRLKLEQSTNNIRNMIIQAPVAMCILEGPDLVLTVANKMMYELWGKEQQQLLNKPIFEALFEVRDQGFEELLTNVYTSGERYVASEVQARLPRQEGLQSVIVNLTYEPLKDINGSVTGIIAVAVEVTSQVEARRNVEESEERSRLAIDSADLGFYEVFFNNDEIIYNHRCEEIFGLNKESKRSDFVKRFHPDDVEIRNEANRLAAETGGLQYEVRVIRPDESISWVRVVGKTFKDISGNPLKIVGVIQDITEQKEFAAQLEKKVAERTADLAEANMQLQQSNIELNQFAYIASHDLQEPLRKVRTFTELLHNNLPGLSGKAESYMHKIMHSAERMQNLINDVLKFSLLSKEREKFERVNLNLVMKQILEDFEVIIEQKNATINVDNLPQIDGISVQMRQIWHNLVSNSLKFSSVERPLQIDISCREMKVEEVKKFPELDFHKKHYCIEFKDNGIGFSQENADKIFIIFQRLHGKMEYEGTGIGLAMCKKIVQNHNGVIYANAAMNQGASFTIILPARQSMQVDNPVLN